MGLLRFGAEPFAQFEICELLCNVCVRFVLTRCHNLLQLIDSDSRRSLTGSGNRSQQHQEQSRSAHKLMSRFAREGILAADPVLVKGKNSLPVKVHPIPVEKQREGGEFVSTEPLSKCRAREYAIDS